MGRPRNRYRYFGKRRVDVLNTLDPLALKEYHDTWNNLTEDQRRELALRAVIEDPNEERTVTR